MSYQIQNAAYLTRLGNLPAKFVLQIICDHAGPDGFGWPSIERIAFRTEIKRRTVQRVFQVFAAIGLIELRDRGPGTVTPGIQVNLERLGSDLTEEYAFHWRAAQGKRPGARCPRVRVARCVSGELFAATTQNVSETPENVSQTPENVSQTFSPNPYIGRSVSTGPVGEPSPARPRFCARRAIPPSDPAELQARRLFEELKVPSDSGLRDLGAQAIRMQSAEWGGPEPAMQRILEAARRARASGVSRWRFWLMDQGYLPGYTPEGGYRHGSFNRSQQRTNGNLAALAESIARDNQEDAGDFGRGETNFDQFFNTRPLCITAYAASPR
jgi:Helix-turn-helix domain